MDSDAKLDLILQELTDLKALLVTLQTARSQARNVTAVTEAIKCSSADRVRRYRERKRLEKQEDSPVTGPDVTPSNVTDPSEGVTSNVTSVTERTQEEKRELIKAIIQGKAKSMAPPTTKRPEFPANAAWTWITEDLQSAQPKEVMQWMGWLWKQGYHDLNNIKSMVEAAISAHPRAPFAYLQRIAPSIHDEAAINEAQDASEATKTADRAWLSGS